MVHDISIIVTTCDRPLHLHQCLWSLARQDADQTAFEIVIAGDGLCGDVLDVAERFAREVKVPLVITRQEYRGFRVAQSRNNGVAASSGGYLLFLDGDCVLPPDYLSWQVSLRQPKVAVVGDSYRLGPGTTQQVWSDGIVDFNQLQALVTPRERVRVAMKALKSCIYSKLHVPMRPRLTGNNFGIWRKDFEAINGFDESYVGWGLEDTDLQRRLYLSGVRFRTILRHAVPIHLWHVPHETYRRRVLGTPNYRRYRKAMRSPWCECGLKRPRLSVSFRLDSPSALRGMQTTGRLKTPNYVD